MAAKIYKDPVHAKLFKYLILPLETKSKLVIQS